MICPHCQKEIVLNVNGERNKRIRELYADKTIPLKVIASDFAISDSGICQIIKRSGGKLRRNRQAAKEA